MNRTICVKDFFIMCFCDLCVSRSDLDFDLDLKGDLLDEEDSQEEGFSQATQESAKEEITFPRKSFNKETPNSRVSHSSRLLFGL
jgi:hypothetical protein